MVIEKLVSSPFNHLRQLLAWEYFIESGRWLKSLEGSCCLNVQGTIRKQGDPEHGTHRLEHMTSHYKKTAFENFKAQIVVESDNVDIAYNEKKQAAWQWIVSTASHCTLCYNSTHTFWKRCLFFICFVMCILFIFQTISSGFILGFFYT